MLDARRAGRQCRLVDIAPQYVDVAVKRFQQNFADVPVTLEATGQSFGEVSDERQ
jgi:DNA modification methylase